MQVPKENGTGALGCLVRLFWMFLGIGVLWFMLAAIFIRQPGRFSVYDILYWVIAVSLLGARYVDVRYLKGETASGDGIATLKDWRRYAIILLPVLFGAWIAAHALGKFFR